MSTLKTADLFGLDNHEKSRDRSAYEVTIQRPRISRRQHVHHVANMHWNVRYALYFRNDRTEG